MKDIKMTEEELKQNSRQIGSFIMAAQADERYYLECNGAEYNKEDYLELVEIWDKYYSDQDWYKGSDNTKFRVPNHNKAGLFMRSVGGIENYQEGEITTCSTKIPSNPFTVDTSHSHTIEEISINTKAHRHLFGEDICVSSSAGDKFTISQGSIPMKEKDPNQETYTAIIDIKPFDIKVNESSIGTLTTEGGDIETAPAAFVTKFWVVAKHHIGLAIDGNVEISTGDQLVTSINDMSGFVEIEGRDIPNNLAFLNFQTESVNLNVTDVEGAIATLNGKEGTEVTITGNDMENVVSSVSIDDNTEVTGYPNVVIPNAPLLSQLDFDNLRLGIRKRDPLNRRDSEGELLKLRRKNWLKSDLNEQISPGESLDLLSFIDAKEDHSRIATIDGSVMRLENLSAIMNYSLNCRINLLVEKNNLFTLFVELYNIGSGEIISTKEFTSQNRIETGAISSLFYLSTNGLNHTLSTDGFGIRLASRLVHTGIPIDIFVNKVQFILKSNFVKWL